MCTSSMDFSCSLASQSISRFADGATRSNHIIHNSDHFTIDIEVLGRMLDGVSINPRLFKVRKLTANSLIEAASVFHSISNNLLM